MVPKRDHPYWSCLAVLAGSLALFACIPDLGSDDEPIDAQQATEDAAPAPDTMPDAEVDLLALGEQVYFTAGGVPGCSLCHGLDGAGGDGSGGGSLGPRILNADRALIADALSTVNEMSYLDLSELEIDAVAVYLAWLLARE